MATRHTHPVEPAATETDTEAVAQAYVRMWNARDYAAIPDRVSESFVMYDPAAAVADVPGPAGEVHGRAGLGQFMDAIDTAFPDFEITILDMLTDETLAMYEVRLTMTHEGPFGGLPPTGRRVEIRGVSILRVTDGVVDEHRFHTNMADVTEQLGLSFPAILRQLPRLVLGKVRSSL